MKTARLIPTKGGHERDMLCKKRSLVSRKAGVAKSAKKSYNKRLRASNVLLDQDQNATSKLFVDFCDKQKLVDRKIPFIEVQCIYDDWDYDGCYTPTTTIALMVAVDPIALDIAGVYYNNGDMYDSIAM